MAEETMGQRIARFLFVTCLLMFAVGAAAAVYGTRHSSQEIMSFGAGMAVSSALIAFAGAIAVWSSPGKRR